MPRKHPVGRRAPSLRGGLFLWISDTQIPCTLPGYISASSGLFNP